MIEALDPSYVKSLLESIKNNTTNLNVDLLSVRRTIQSLMPSSGRYASIPPDDYVHWIDTQEYSVTETTWTEKTRCIVKPRNLLIRTYILHIGITGRVDTAGQTLYVRIRSHYKGVLCTITFTETSYVYLECHATYVAPGWWDDPLYVEAFVTGGTGYVKNTQINFVRTNVIEGWTYTLGSGEHFKPIRVTEDGKLLAVVEGFKNEFTLFSDTVTSDGASADISVERYSALELELKVTAVSGTTPTLNVYIEGKFNTTGDYKPLVYQEGISTTGIWYFIITQLIFKTIRVRWTVGGTSPSFTFRVDAVGKA